MLDSLLDADRLDEIPSRERRLVYLRPHIDIPPVEPRRVVQRHGDQEPDNFVRFPDALARFHIDFLGYDPNQNTGCASAAT